MNEFKKALQKKALGYEAEETVIEYDAEDKLLKKKVTTKYYPPDIYALKAILAEADNTGSMTDDELKIERTRLINELRAQEAEYTDGLQFGNYGEKNEFD